MWNCAIKIGNWLIRVRKGGGEIKSSVYDDIVQWEEHAILHTGAFPYLFRYL